MRALFHSDKTAVGAFEAGAEHAVAGDNAGHDIFDVILPVDRADV